jgi:coenzyme PQQ precursor peptide PqqA
MGSRTRRPTSQAFPHINRTMEELSMITWTKPSFTDLRFGMEVTMYILNR